MSANQNLACAFLGWVPAINSVGVSAQAQGNNSTWLGISFVPDQSKSITQFSAYMSALSGTPNASDIECDIYSDASGSPSSSLVTSTSLTAVAAVGWNRWTITSTALTAGTQYWAVIKNNFVGSATPTWRYVGISGSPFFAQTPVVSGNYGNYIKTWNGSVWSSAVFGGASGFRIGYSDSTYVGMPIQNLVLSSNPQIAWNTNQSQVGIKFTLPSGATWNVRGVSLFIAKTGSPTGNLYFNLWQGASPTSASVTATYKIPNATDALGGSFRSWGTAFFPSTIAIPGGTIVRITAANDTTDSTANAFSTLQATWDSDANSTPLIPFEGTAQGTYTTNGTAGTPTWNDLGSTPVVTPFSLLLDTGGEFASVGSGYSRSRVVSGT